MVNSVGPVQRSVIVVSADIKEGKYEAFQELMKSEAGLKTTRNYEGCNHVESFFNEESNKYIVIEHWDSSELYNAYADWRFNEDPSGLVKEMIPLLNGGENGMEDHRQPHQQNHPRLDQRRIDVAFRHRGTVARPVGQNPAGCENGEWVHSKS